MIHPNVFPTAIPLAPLVCAPLNATLVGVTMAVDTVSALEVVGLGTVIVLFVPFVFPPITRLKVNFISTEDILGTSDTGLIGIMNNYRSTEKISFIDWIER